MDEKRVYAALVSLRGNPDFDTVMSWIEDEREVAKERMALAPIERVQNLQGVAAGFKIILDAVKAAPDVVRQMKTP